MKAKEVVLDPLCVAPSPALPAVSFLFIGVTQDLYALC